MTKTLTAEDHDRVARFIARNRFPFPDQTDWPAGYTTLTNVGQPVRGIDGPDGEHFPDIVILDEQGVPCRLGEVELVVDAAAIARWALCSATADTKNETGVRNLFVYVPQGLGRQALEALDANGISFAGLREFRFEDGDIRIDPVLTRGDRYDHRSS
jgi:hypothetical protein